MREKDIKELRTQEIIAYGVAGFGQNIIYALSFYFLNNFYTDAFGLTAAAAGTLMLVAKFWDAVMDPIMGTIVDRTRSRWGKLRPFLLFAPIPLAVFTILTFSAPQLNDTMKLVYAYVTYLLWGTIYSACDVPYWGLSAAMTADTQKRAKLISFTRILTMLGIASVYVLMPQILPLFSGMGYSPEAIQGATPELQAAMNRQGYFWVAIILTVVGCVLLTLAFFKTRERATQNAERPKLMETLKLVGKNKPLLLLLLSGLLGATMNTVGFAGIYFAKYNLGDEGALTLLAALNLGGMVVAMALLPLLTKRFSKRNIYIAGNIFGAVVSFAFYFIGYSSGILNAVAYVLIGLSSGIFTVLQTALIGDTVDYLQWKTGKRAEGICFAGQTFITKVTAGLSNAAVMWVLAATAFQANAQATPAVKDGIFMTITLLPAIGCALSIIPLFFYKFTEKQQKMAVEEINAREGSMPESVEHAL